PVDRTGAGHQRGGLAISDQRVVFERCAHDACGTRYFVDHRMSCITRRGLPCRLTELERQPMVKIRRWMAPVLAIGVTAALPGCVRTAEPVLTFSGSVVGREADVMRRALE